MPIPDSEVFARQEGAVNHLDRLPDVVAVEVGVAEGRLNQFSDCAHTSSNFLTALTQTLG